LKKSLFICLGFLIPLFCLHTPAKAQILKDTATFNLIKRGVDYIYSFQFDKANTVYVKLKTKYPQHPIPLLFRGMLSYWMHFPLIPSSPAAPAFEKDLLRCIEICEKERSKTDEPEYLLCDIGARGLLLLYYADNDLSMSVVSLASKTYQLVMRSFDYTKDYNDFYFITGLYNYYREAYPEAHPVYKPFAVLFPRGDKQKGLEELKLAAGGGIFLKAEAYSFLTGIYISFENNYPMAFRYSQALYEKYPQNNQFRAVYIKNLLLIKRYSEAETLLTQPWQPDNNYFVTLRHIFRGILMEKKYKNHIQAETYYQNGIRSAELVGAYANEYQAYAYFGLSRIMKSRNEMKLSKSYYKKAMDLAAFKNVNYND
jgi:hypothetical protein